MNDFEIQYSARETHDFRGNASDERKRAFPHAFPLGRTPAGGTKQVTPPDQDALVAEESGGLHEHRPQ